MSQANTAKIVRSGLWLTSSFAVAKLSQFISQLFLARLLSPKEFGIWGMVLVVTTLSALFKEHAIASVLIQRGLDDKKRIDAVYSLGITFSIGMFILQALIGYPVSCFFGIPLLWPLIACAGLVFVIGAGAGVRDAMLQQQMKFQQVAICEISMGVARLGGAVLWASLGGGVWSFVIGELCMESANAICSRWFCRYKFNYRLIPDRQAVQEVRGYITSLISINLAVYANTNSDNFLVGKLLGATSLGFYGIAYQLAMLPTFALSQINKVSFPVLAQRDATGQQSYVCQVLELYAILYAPVYGIGFVTAPWLIPTLYGVEWTSAVVPFQIILVFAYTRGFMAILGTALNAMNKPGVNAVINWAFVPISVPAFYLGAQMGGITGVAIAVALVMGVGATIWFWLAICRTARWQLKTLISPVLIPTGTILIAIVGALQLSQFVSFRVVFQPFLLIGIYLIGVSLLSRGRISKTLASLIRRSI
ncbi:MAG: oligosaccharide flippase family protein [Kovacikia sp.]